MNVNYKKHGVLNNVIILLVGKSGSGKSTVADYLHDHYGYAILQSYTTREKRSEDETGHIFVDMETYEAIPNKVATTEFDGHMYCASEQQIDMNDIYIIDPLGVETLKRNYLGKKHFHVVYLDISMETSLARMRKRGDSEDECWSRLRHDEQAFNTAEENAQMVLDAELLFDDIADRIYTFAKREDDLYELSKTYKQ